MRNRYWLDGMMGLVVGDALGVPVQFMRPEEIANRPQGKVTGMEGHGCYDMPIGSWSDDSSMALATLDSINVKGKLNPDDVMANFVKWLYEGEYTPAGITFDEGITCSRAISSFAENPDPTCCGITGEYANGNGALMRIMPVCLYVYDVQKMDAGVDDETAVKLIHQISSLTHNHLRSDMACGLYYFMVREILDHKGQKSLQECLQDGLNQGFRYYGAAIENLVEMSHYGRLFHLGEFRQIPDHDIKFSGYVVDSLEAAVWALLQTSSYKDCLLKIVNYGDDSDTVGAIAGGLAALYYGYENIPADWISVIKRKDWIEQMALLDFRTKNPVVDMHCHMIPDVDDGSTSMEMSVEMLRMSYQQGVRDVFLTSHSWGVVHGNTERYLSGFELLKKLCANEMPKLRLHIGAEVLCEYEEMEAIIRELQGKQYFSLDESKYVLAEFYDYDMGLDGAKYCLQKLIDAGYIPIIAHVERYSEMLPGGIKDVQELKESGCLVQINMYSVSEEPDEVINQFANEMLKEKLVDVVGTDSHRTTHRAPRLTKGMETLYKNYDAAYVDGILYKNAGKIFGLNIEKRD